ncbi:MAG TPA: Wzt carbohydrate-binding domain-containing protein [Bryobacteraceae bacterium]|jgi:lipopolysaccharide transport system ATP-binding protein
MAIEFRDVSLGPITGIGFAAPSHAIIGLIGEKSCGITEILRLAAGLDQPSAGEVSGPADRRYVAAQDAVSPAPVDLLALDHSLDKYDAVVRARTIVSLGRLRRSGATILVASHQEDLLERLCDEVWWIHEGRVAAKGFPGETLNRYRTHVASRIEAWGATLKPRLESASRFGTQSAIIESIELLDSEGNSTTAWHSGAEVAVRITLHFVEAVADPVIGLLIRTRIGLEAYGVNTRMEGLKVGARAPGETAKVVFKLRCELAAGSYTLTAAAQAQDGTTHDWLDDAVGFVVVDDRPTAGIVNLHARVSVEA